ncbi:MAG: ATP-dependent DNA ligase [Burkholderiaceae bacterium]|nr:ATP-dependent DNA ligase [Burkholderiaceae bacterium]
MKAFADLYAQLDATTSTTRKVDAMARYFAHAPADDAAWAAYFLAGGRPRRLVPVRALVDAALRASALPQWLFAESYDAVGDLAETVALLLPEPAQRVERGLAQWMTRHVLRLRGARPAEIENAIVAMWRSLAAHERFVLNKLLTGEFRVGVSRQLVLRALARAFDVDGKRLAHRFVGYVDGAHEPDAHAFRALVSGDDVDGSASLARPYPFFLSHPLQQPPETLGDVADWVVEWKWDGIRAQLVRRGGQAWLWSRGEELVTDRFPEVVDAARSLPDGIVVDGELLAWDAQAARPLPFATMQRRIGRLKLGPKLLREAPVALLAFDLLEHDGVDVRGLPLALRRGRLEALVEPRATAALQLSPRIEAPDWDALARLREESRGRGVEGMMIKRAQSAYGVGRSKSIAVGDWWKWKIDPLSVDCVLVYAQPGHGRRASLYTDYTFAVWSGPPQDDARTLVPFAKAYSGLTDDEIREVDATVRRTTVERFGPVRAVAPTMVFELGFEGIRRSTRHKSGIAVRFPRMLRRRPDKPVEDADTLQALQALLALGETDDENAG